LLDIKIFIFLYFVGIFYAFTILGPAIGYLAGGAFLNFYVDINAVDPDR
jgi:organic anion transporter 4A/organic anion transporter 4C